MSTAPTPIKKIKTTDNEIHDIATAHKLTITGAVVPAKEFDGSKDVTVTIPTIKGPTGATGPVGPIGPTGPSPAVTATATIDALIGTPAITVTNVGTTYAPKFKFAFSKLKGVTGATGATGPAGPVNNYAASNSVAGPATSVATIKDSSISGYRPILLSGVNESGVGDDTKVHYSTQLRCDPTAKKVGFGAWEYTFPNTSGTIAMTTDIPDIPTPAPGGGDLGKFIIADGNGGYYLDYHRYYRHHIVLTGPVGPVGMNAKFAHVYFDYYSTYASVYTKESLVSLHYPVTCSGGFYKDPLVEFKVELDSQANPSAWVTKIRLSDGSGEKASEEITWGYITVTDDVVEV